MTDLDGFLTEAESTALDAALLAATPRPVIN
jgi:hypothetical protein